MKKGVVGLVSAVSFIALFCFCGDSGTNVPVEAVTTTPLASLRLDSTVVVGLKETNYSTGDTSQVFNSVNGGAIQFIAHGMKSFSKQEMDKSGASVKLVIIDFITVANAKSMFAWSKASFGALALAWGTYSPGNVFIHNDMSTSNICAQINKYYFELQFYTNDDSLGTQQTAQAVYNKYISLIK
jgi:hypothetical protein